MKDHEARLVAEAQHGVVSRAQCRLLEVSMRGHAGATWEVLSPRVLRLVGAPRTGRTDVMAAALDAGAGAAASHVTAAALWHLPGFALLPAHVSRPRGVDGKGKSLGRLHEPRCLPAHHCTVLDGIPVTTPARALFDLAGAVHPDRVARAVDATLAKSPAVLRALHRMLPELAERGRPGIRAMRAILDERPMGYLAPESALESRVIRLLKGVGVRARRQVDLGGDDWIGRVDLLIERAALVIEVDSARFHTAKLDRERDQRRDAQLATVGLRVLRIAEEDVWSRPDEVVGRVLSACRSAA